MTTYEEQAKIFKAFCDDKRLRILELLRSGEKCACVLIEEMDIAQSALSYHMKILVESGVVESWPVGKWTHYRISEKGRGEVLRLLNELTRPNTLIEKDCCCGK